MKSEQLRIVFLFERLAAIPTALTKTIREYLRYMESTRCCSVNTILTYGRHLTPFAAFCKDRDIKAVTQITPQLVFDYLAVLKQEGKASKSIYVAFEALKMLVKFAIVTGKSSRH